MSWRNVHALACCIGFVSTSSTIAAWVVGTPYGWPLTTTIGCAVVAAVASSRAARARREPPQWQLEVLRQLQQTHGDDVRIVHMPRQYGRSQLVADLPGTVQCPTDPSPTPRRAR